MEYNARMMKVFISSPDDVVEERKIARDLINHWNSIWSINNEIILLPLGWDQELPAGFGKPPQEMINEELLRKSDLLIGIFGEKIGTSTGEFISGTVEEIERHTLEGKQALLFFKKMTDENTISDQEQYAKLHEFKESIQHRCFYREYSSNEDFKDILRDELYKNMQKYVADFQRAKLQKTAKGDDPNIDMLKVYIDQWGMKLEIESMNGWLTNFTGSVFKLGEKKYDSLHSLMLWLFCIKLGPGNEDFADAFSKFGQILRDVLILIVEATHLYDNGIYMLEKNYQEVTYGSETYDYLAKTYDFHTDLIKDYGAELCRATNFIIDLYREKANPLYLIELGNIYVMDGPNIRLKYYYRYCKYKASNTIPYISYDDFLVSRTERDLYFGAGKNIKDPDFLKTYRKR